MASLRAELTGKPDTVERAMSKAATAQPAEAASEPVTLSDARGETATGGIKPAREVPARRRKTPMIFAVAGCLFWIGSAGAFLWGYFGPEQLLALSPHLIAFAAAVTFIPPFLFIAAAYVLLRAQELAESARRLAAASETLMSVDDTSVASAQRLGRTVRRELDALSSGLDGAFNRLRALETALEGRIAELEEAGARAGVATEAIAQRLGKERQRIEHATEALDTAATRAAETWGNRSTQIAESLAKRLREERNNIEQLGEALDVTANRAAEAWDSRSAQIFDSLAQRLREERQSIEQLSETVDSIATRAAEAWDGRSTQIADALAKRLREERNTIEQLGEAIHMAARQAAKNLSEEGTSAVEGISKRLIAEREAIQSLQAQVDETVAKAIDAISARNIEVPEAVARRLAKEREDIEKLAQTLDQSATRAAESFGARALEISEGFSKHLGTGRENIEAFGRTLEQAATRVAEALTARGHEIAETMERRLEAEREGLTTLAETVEQASARAAENLGSRSTQLTEAMAQRLREERQALEEEATTLEAASSRAAETLAGKTAQLKALIEAASGSLKSAGHVLETQTAQFREAAEKASAAPHAAALELDRQAKQIEGIADNVVARAEFVLARQERQRGTMNELLAKLKEDTTEFEAVLDGQRKATEAASAQLAAQVQRLDELTLEGLRRVESAVATASSRTSQLVAGFGKDADRVKDTTEEAANAMTRLVENLREAATSAEALITDSTSNATKRSKDLVGEAMESCEKLLRASTKAAEEAEKARAMLTKAADDTERHIANLPGIAAREAERVREALTSETEKILDNSARVLAAVQGRAGSRKGFPAAEEPQQPQPQPELPAPESPRDGLRGLARRITGARRQPEERPRGGFALSAVLAAADANDSSKGATMRPGATAALNTLQTALADIAVDLDWNTSENENPALWRRYLEGDRSVFARKLAGSIGPETVDRIAALYRDNTRFHEAADSYLAEFDTLLKRAREGDRGGLLASTLLSADTGKIYLTVAYALGRLD